MSAQLSRCVAVYSRHFVASRINALAVVVAVVFTLDHIVTTQTTMGWTKSLLYHYGQGRTQFNHSYWKKNFL